MEQSKSISLNVFHPEYTTRFFFRIINTICELPEHHTPKELENNIRFLKTLDLIAFQNLVNRVANKEQLKDILKARFESYKGNKQEWLEYTKNNVKLLKRENIIQWDGLVNLWNDWFKEKEQEHNNLIPNKPFELSLRQIALKYIYENEKIRSLEDAKDILKQLGSKYKTFSKLFNHYTNLFEYTNRVIEGNDESRKKKNDMIKDMEIILQYLEGTQAKDRCLKEISIIKESL
jgi:hypothetical protein